MPELPEVEVVRAGLEPAVTGTVVESVEILDERSLRRHAGPAEDYVDRLTGARLETPRRRGKFLWIPVAESAEPAGSLPSAPATPLSTPRSTPLSSSEMQDGRDLPPVFSGEGEPDSAAHPAFRKGLEPVGQVGRAGQAAEALVVHLGMSGQVLLRAPDAPVDRLTRIVTRVRHPEHGALRLDFVDQRIFGSMALDALVATPDVAGDTVPTQVAHIARDPMDVAFDERRFLAALAKKDTGIKRAMLDQTLISGIGNIYADEALWAARLHYAQPTRSISRAKARELLGEVRSVLTKALAEGGTSFDAQYVNVNGASGYFSHSLNVYGQQGEPCPRCGTAVIRESFMNRGSHFCPRCQRVRAPRTPRA